MSVATCIQAARPAIADPPGSMGGGTSVAHDALDQVKKASPPVREGPDVGRSELDKRRLWRMAVAEHRPGEWDSAVKTIGSWSRGGADIVLSEAKHRHGGNNTLKRGALLLTDIALMAPEAFGGSPTTTAWVVQDGRLIEQHTPAAWEYARYLLDQVSPSPSGDELVRQWYLATSAYLLSRRNWGDAQFQLGRASELFPSDAGILFYDGMLHEAYSGGRIQAFRQAVGLPYGSTHAVESRESELRQARRFLLQAVRADPSRGPAHLRLGHVSGLLGDHNAAVIELHRAAATLTEPRDLYYVALFVGHSEAALGHRDAARAQFERAALLFPRAQSPPLALSELAMRHGDRPGALAALAPALAPAPAERRDPWWDYDVAHVANADKLMAEMRRAFGALGR